MIPGDLDALFDQFHATVVRLETLPAYDVGGDEAERIKAWQHRRPRPVRSRTSPWLARIAVSTAAGKSWRRVRVLDEPPTEYQRYQLGGYIESQAAGEQITVVTRAAVGRDLGPDFWLFDAGTDCARAAVMRYDPDGRWLGADLVTESAVLAELDSRCREAAELADPLNVYLAARDDRRA